jgi:internalin A
MAQRARKATATAEERILLAKRKGSGKLDLSGADLTDLPTLVFGMDLRSLDLSHNQLTDLPDELSQLSNLEHLVIASNPLQRIPEVVLSLASLEDLDVSSTHLTEMNPSIARLRRLQMINCDNNPLVDLPSALSRLPQLRMLYLRACQLTDFPPVVFECTQLGYLHISKNQLVELPLELRRLSKLRTFDAASNLLLGLPDFFDQLGQLTRLDLANNKLTSLPQSMRSLHNLETLKLQGNPLPLPSEAFSLPAADILTLYFNLNVVSTVPGTQEAPRRPLNEAKMLVLGQGGVGKTSLIRRLLGEDFLVDEKVTQGIRISPFGSLSGNGNVQINIWDFGGQDIMHATHQFFFTDRSLYLLVIDSRRGEQESRLEYWLKLIASFGGESPVIIVCNRADENRIELDWSGLRRKYPAIRRFVQGVSARTGEGVDEMLQAIRETAGALDHVHQPLLESWLCVKDQLTNMRLSRSYLSYQDYQALCAREGVTDPASQQALVRLLTALGTVLNFDDNRLLKDTNVLEPNWVTSGVYAILNCNELFQAQGVLKFHQIGNILPQDRYPPDQHEFIIAMMRKFELCFEFEGFRDPRYLVADLLPLSAPDTGSWDGALCFEYHYDVLPSSVISRFIVRMHQFISHDTYWRRGVVLERDGHRALVKADIEDRIISIAVAGRGDERRAMLGLIRADFERIHETIPKLRVAEKIPIPGYPGVLADYLHVVRLSRKGEVKFIPEGMDQHVSVGALLGEIETGDNRDRRSDFPPPVEKSPSHSKTQRLVHPLFVFVVALVLISAAGIAAGGGITVLPIAIVGTILAVVLVYVFEENRAGRIGEKTVLAVVKGGFAQFRFIHAGDKRKG